VLSTFIAAQVVRIQASLANGWARARNAALVELRFVPDDFVSSRSFAEQTKRQTEDDRLRIQFDGRPERA